MSAKVDQFCDDLHDRLNAIEARIESAKTSIQAVPANAQKAVRDRFDEARARVRAQKNQIEKARADLKTWAEHKKAHTDAAVREWKTKRQARKLNARADDAETYARTLVAIALATIDEAEVAILEAVAARMDAEAVADHTSSPVASQNA
jgi:hypothetical protein